MILPINALMTEIIMKSINSYMTKMCNANDDDDDDVEKNEK